MARGDGLFRTDVFVVCIWNEARELEGAPAVWRGSVEYVQTKQVRYFQSFDRMVAFIAEIVPGLPDHEA